MFKREAEKFNPWKRKHQSTECCDPDPDELHYFQELRSKRPKFYHKPENLYLDIHTKRASLEAAPCVVALKSYSGEEELIQGSGTIIECDNNNRCIVLTSANLIRRVTKEFYMENVVADNLKVVVYSDGKSYDGEVYAYDFHYNLAALRFQSDSPATTAKLTYVDDSISVRLTHEEKSSLRPHSSSSKLVPGDGVVAMGRYFAKPFDLMAAPGVLSLGRCEEYDCEELLKSNCRITRCGDGGPLINHFGEVIGITYYEFAITPFLPINVANKWWEHYKRFGESCRPSLGIKATNFYAADIEIIEKIIRKFPSICKGVFVEKVIPGSSADSAGIRLDDVIVQCGGKPVQSLLEFFEIMWDKVGGLVELVVARPRHAALLHLKMVVEATSDNLNRWPRLPYKDL